MPILCPVTTRNTGRDAVLCKRKKKKWGGRSALITMWERAKAIPEWDKINRVCDIGSHSTSVGACPQTLDGIGGKCFCFVINREQQDKLSDGDGFVLDHKFKKKKSNKMFKLVHTAAVGKAMGVARCTWCCCSNPAIIKSTNIQTILMCELHSGYRVRPQVGTVPELSLFVHTQGGYSFLMSIE